MYRSRLVAKDFAPKNKKNDIEGLYVAMPPHELVESVDGERVESQ
jgi:hypothetical protein